MRALGGRDASCYLLFLLSYVCGGWGAKDRGGGIDIVTQPQVFVSSPQPDQLLQEGHDLKVVARLLGLGGGRNNGLELQGHMMVEGGPRKKLLEWNLGEVTEWEERC